MSTQRSDPPAMAWPGENPLVRRQTTGANDEADDAAGVPCWEPNETGATIGSRLRILRVNQSGVRHSVLLSIVVAQAVGIPQHDISSSLPGGGVVTALITAP